eukprot:scaffold7236_cov69-Phaeocystis_antarctica.AAC.6
MHGGADRREAMFVDGAEARLRVGRAAGGTAALHGDLSDSGAPLECVEQPSIRRGPPEEARLPSRGTTKRPLSAGRHAESGASTSMRAQAHSGSTTASWSAKRHRLHGTTTVSTASRQQRRKAPQQRATPRASAASAEQSSSHSLPRPRQRELAAVARSSMAAGMPRSSSLAT